MATTRVTTDALAFLLGLPTEIVITEIEVTEVDEGQQTLTLHLEGGELEDIEHSLQYKVDHTYGPELMGIEPKSLYVDWR